MILNCQCVRNKKSKYHMSVKYPEYENRKNHGPDHGPMARFSSICILSILTAFYMYVTIFTFEAKYDAFSILTLVFCIINSLYVAKKYSTSFIEILHMHFAIFTFMSIFLNKGIIYGLFYTISFIFIELMSLWILGAFQVYVEYKDLNEDKN